MLRRRRRRCCCSCSCSLVVFSVFVCDSIAHHAYASSLSLLLARLIVQFTSIGLSLFVGLCNNNISATNDENKKNQRIAIIAANCAMLLYQVDLTLIFDCHKQTILYFGYIIYSFITSTHIHSSGSGTLLNACALHLKCLNGEGIK